MDIKALVVFLAVGAVSGWLAGKIMKGGGFGLLGDIILGVLGAIIGGSLFGRLGLVTAGLIGEIVTAVAGAVVLLFVIRLVKKGA